MSGPVKILAALLLAIAFGLAAATGAASVASSVYPALARSFALVPFGHAVGDLGRKVDQQKPAAEIAADAARLLNRAPLADEPLTLAAAALAREGRLEAADALMREALKRNPRSALVRGWNVERAAAAGRYGTAIAELEVLMRVDPDRYAQYLDVMAGLAADPAARPALLETVGGGGNWTWQLSQRLAVRNDDPAFVHAVAMREPSVRGRYLMSLAERGAFDEALLAWLAFLGPQAQPFTWPYDGGFAGLGAPAPFGWTLEAAKSELQEGGGLYAFNPGRGEEAIAWQVMPLGPGAYRLTVAAMVETRPRGAAFRWTLNCLPDGRPLATLDLGAAQGEASPSVAFSVPAAGCAFQRLGFASRPGELPLAARVTLRKVSIAALQAPPAGGE